MGARKSLTASSLSSLIPGLLGGGERKAWYILFAHALNRPDIPWRLDSIVTHPWNNDVTKCFVGIFWKTQSHEANERLITYALKCVGKLNTCLSFKPACASCTLQEEWYIVLPFMLDISVAEKVKGLERQAMPPLGKCW